MNNMHNMILPLKPVRVVVNKDVKRPNRGRPAAFENKKAIAAVLRGEKKITRFLTIQLVDMGYLIAVPLKEGRRGRPAYGYELTSKGKALVALSKNWFSGKKNEVSDDDIVNAVEMIEGNENLTEDDVLENYADACFNAEEIREIQAESEVSETPISIEVETVEGDDNVVPEASNDDAEVIQEHSETFVA